LDNRKEQTISKVKFNLEQNVVCFFFNNNGLELIDCSAVQYVQFEQNVVCFFFNNNWLELIDCSAVQYVQFEQNVVCFFFNNNGLELIDCSAVQYVQLQNLSLAGCYLLMCLIVNWQSLVGSERRTHLLSFQGFTFQKYFKTIKIKN
jgi:hypothetical protein